jgi:peptidoglycan/LPS O-acetylase OafA/YrhL
MIGHFVPRDAAFAYLDHWIYAVPLFRIWEFFFGCCVGRLFLMPSSYLLETEGRRNAVLAACGAMILVVIWLARRAPWIEAMSWYVLFTPIFAVIILSVASGRTILSKPLESTPVVWLGEASYGLYLLHFPPTVILERIYASEPAPRLLTIGVILACLIGSIICLKFIEIPARRYLRALANRWQMPTPLPAGPVLEQLPAQRRPELNGAATGF